MWICLNNGFLSAVEDRNDHDFLMVRARRKEHLEAVFPERINEIYTVPNSDYAYRISVSKKLFAHIISESIINKISYPNFKNSVKDKILKRFYGLVWWNGLEMQDETA